MEHKNRIEKYFDRIYCIDCDKFSIPKKHFTELQWKKLVAGVVSVRCPYCVEKLRELGLLKEDILPQIVDRMK